MDQLAPTPNTIIQYSGGLDSLLKSYSIIPRASAKNRKTYKELLNARKNTRLHIWIKPLLPSDASYVGIVRVVTLLHDIKHTRVRNFWERLGGCPRRSQKNRQQLGDVLDAFRLPEALPEETRFYAIPQPTK